MVENNIVGLQIAKGRHELSLSQAEFAKLLHISHQAVGKWERGESLPDIFMLVKIAKLIKQPNIAYFVGTKTCQCSCGCLDCVE